MRDNYTARRPTEWVGRERPGGRRSSRIDGSGWWLGGVLKRDRIALQQSDRSARTRVLTVAASIPFPILSYPDYCTK